MRRPRGPHAPAGAADGWTAALAAAPLSARLAAPQLGVAQDRYPDETAAFFETPRAEQVPAVLVIGGADLVSEDVAAAIGDDVRAWED